MITNKSIIYNDIKYTQYNLLILDACKLVRTYYLIHSKLFIIKNVEFQCSN